jgi:glycosyltransferase involved in cell wall biosynthesis
VPAKRIAIDASRTTRAQRTGTENYALKLIRALLERDRVNHYTLYFRDAPPPGLFPPQPNATHKVIPFPRLWTHLRFAAALFRDRPDVTFVPAHSLPILFPGRAIVTIHDLGYRLFPGAHTGFSRRYLEWSTRYSARRASVIVADSQATADDLQRFYGTNPARIRVIYPGVEGLTRATPEQIEQVRARSINS